MTSRLSKRVWINQGQSKRTIKTCVTERQILHSWHAEGGLPDNRVTVDQVTM